MNSERLPVNELVPESAQTTVSTATEDACNLAESIKVTTPELYLSATDALKTVKGAQKIVKATKEGLLDPTKLIIERIKTFFEGPEARLVRAENLLKREMLAYDEQVKEEQRRQQASLDEKARQERLKKEEQSRKAWEAAKAAADEGNQAKALKLQNKANMLADVSASIVAPTVVLESPRTAGVTTRETWSATVTNLEDLIVAVASGIIRNRAVERSVDPMEILLSSAVVPVQALKADGTFLNSMARVLKVKGEIYPGVFGVVSRGIAAGSK